jgi:hypothetical protein
MARLGFRHKRGRLGFEVRYKGLSVKPELVMAAVTVANVNASYTIPSNTSCMCCRPAFSIWVTASIEITYPLSRILHQKSGAAYALRLF